MVHEEWLPELEDSIGDVCDAGRWMVKEGIADPSKLAIVGWSYGGYAALQANVLDPDLFKAVVAVAPVTDLGLLKSQARQYTNSVQVQDFVGSGPHVVEGSPAQNAKAFKAAVIMFQGDKDLNVDIAQSKKMDQGTAQRGQVESAGDLSEARSPIARQRGARRPAAQVGRIPAQAAQDVVTCNICWP